MAIFLKYIVLFLLTFNIISANASDIVLELEDDNNPRYISTDFKSPLNLPHPIVFKHMILDNRTNQTGRMVLIAYYFDVKYPNNIIDYDFSDDVAIIFDDLTASEVQKRTTLIRTLVKLYRWGVHKYKDIAENIMVPEAPPLVVDDDEYAFLGSVDYVPVPEGSFAVINEFKKVVSYSDNPKDVKAMEAFKIRQLEQKENKTDYEKLQSMFHKLEFSKIPRYGVDLPNPFIGNLGIGKWSEEKGYKARAISELAQIKNTDKLLVGIHVNTPTYNFMLANNLSDTLKKPKIELIEQDNIDSYTVHYPASFPLIHENMVYGYIGDFMFPIEIKTKDPNNGIKLTAQITFQNCDEKINCEELKFITPLEIEKNVDNTSSSVKSFVVQSFYNLPQENNKLIELENVYADTSENNKDVTKIHMVFKTSKHTKNFNILIENDQNTVFSAPQINIHDNKIYVTLTPISNAENLINSKITYTLQHNTHTIIRNTIELKPYSNIIKQTEILSLIWFAFCIGLSFYITPIGLALLCMETASSQKVKTNFIYWLTIGCSATILILVLFTAKTFLNINVLWGMQYTNILYVCTCTLITLLMFLSTKYQHRFLEDKNILRAFITGVSVVLFLPVSNTPNLIKLFNLINSDNLIQNYILISLTAIGLSLPFIIVGLIKNKLYNSHCINWLKAISKTACFISLIYLLGLMYMEFSYTSAFKTILMLVISYLVYKYFFNFTDALFETQLSNKKKQITEKIIILLTIAITYISVSKVEKYSIKEIDQTPVIITQEELDNLLRNGKTVIVSLTSDWSYISKFNKFITLNPYTLKHLKHSYNLEYINIHTSLITPEVQDFLEKHTLNDIPAYILYTFNMNKGVILPSLLKDSELEQFIQDFQI